MWTGERSKRLPSNWAALRKRVLARDGYQCRIRSHVCSFHATEVDHIVAGDNHDLGNLQSVCSDCHKQKTSFEASSASRRKRELKLRPRDRHPGERG